MKKRIAGLSVLFVGIILFITAFISKYEADSKKIVIIYTTDVHTKINNEEEGLTYSNVVALKNELESKGKTVFLVDCGDNIQGSVYGAFDEGESIQAIMDQAEYDASAVGNHEFDYGLFRALQVTEGASVPYVACNFCNVITDELMLPAYEIVEKNGIKVAFIGVSTPETITKTTPIYFQDENGNVLYNFSEGKGGTLLYSAVQNAIDEVRDQVDYVVVLGHLGNEYYSEPYRSSDVINNTSGIDLFLDGHSHKMVEKRVYTDKGGKPVVLSQAGSYLGCLGLAEVSKHEIETTLVNEYEQTDVSMDETVAKVMDKVEKSLGKKVAVLNNPLYINDANDSTKRLIRSQDTNISDFVSDSVYWYFNEKLNTACDVAIVNGGGLRTDVEAGDFSCLVSKSIQPFGNVICMVEMSGQEIQDMLEWGARYVGVGESGSLLHTAGLTYKIDKDIETSVQSDNNTYVGPPTDRRKVSDITVYNRETCEYEPLDLNKKYTVAGNNFILRNTGDGYTMLKDTVPVIDYVGEDYVICAEFAAGFAGEGDGFPHISNKSSPMTKYKNYIFDYENPTGSGRMTIE